MGYTKHHAIIVSSFKPEIAKQAHDKAKEIFGEKQVTTLADSPVNILQTFLVAPDNSSEHWSQSEDGNQKRFEFKAWFQTFCYVDGSSPLYWLEVIYNDDKGEPRISESCEDYYHKG